MKRVYFNEFNIPMGRTIYLPLVSGILAAYAKTYPEIKRNYEFMKPLYKRDLSANILKEYDTPAVACFSVSLWNFELSKEIARLVKEKYPGCIIIFGGPSAPFNGGIPGVDYIVNGEGEKKFVNILLCLIGEPEIEVNQEQDLDYFPSPYTSGELDQVIKDDMEFQAIVELTRGCCFSCTYCFWGAAGLNKRFRFHSVEQVKAEADWIGRNRIKYVFCADSNFGMFKRDIEIAQIYADVKAKYGYPEKFRVCYGKNAQESIYETVKILSKAGLAKAITLSKQSDNQAALENVGRKNISTKAYNELQQRYMSEGIPTYVELILGLPGETLESFKQGVQAAMIAKTNLFIYHCSVLPNTEMDRPEYRLKHGIKTVRVPMAEIHCSPREPGAVQEYEEVIVGTNTMTTEEWMKAAVYAWMTQLRYSLGCYVMDSKTEEWFYKIAFAITQGKPRGQIDQRFGNLYFEVEEMALLRINLENGEIDKWCIGNKKSVEDYAKEVVIWGRKS